MGSEATLSNPTPSLPKTTYAEHITQSRGGSRRENHVFLFALFSTFAFAFIRGVGSVKGLGWERESMAGTSLSIPHSPFPIPNLPHRTEALCAYRRDGSFDTNSFEYDLATVAEWLQLSKADPNEVKRG